MCGIVGFIGKEDVKEILLKGLERLEYRGYDSSGISIISNRRILTFKDKGRISHLRTLITDQYSEIGLGHTRWATHGLPNYQNSHPHLSLDGRFTIVHNGVIENEKELYLEYLDGKQLTSDTDTEIVVELISLFVKESKVVEKALEKLIKVLKGSYAIALLDSHNEDKIYVLKNRSPLLIGIGPDFTTVASDALAMIDKTKRFIYLEDYEYAVLEIGTQKIYNKEGQLLQKEEVSLEIEEKDVDKGLYEHFMLKEIEEQPAVIRRIINEYFRNGEFRVDEEICEAIKNSDRLYIIAAGTSYHAGLAAKNILEKHIQIEVSILNASEFNSQNLLFSRNPVCIFISQSGETADSLRALHKVKNCGYKTIALTNVKDSTLYRETDYQLLLYAGREIAVASTKAYTASITVLTILAEAINKNKEYDLSLELGKVASVIDTIIQQKETIKRLVEEYLKDCDSCFFIGRSIDYAIALEAALKLKEISYIHAEGIAAGELKHGTIALIDDKTPTIVIISLENINYAIRANAKEVEARQGKTIYFSMEKCSKENDHFIIPSVLDTLSPLVMIIPLQILAYYAAYIRNLDIDKPRNLAKSVTVE